MKLHEATQIHQKVNPKNSIENFLETFFELEEEFDDRKYWYTKRGLEARVLDPDVNWVECYGVVQTPDGFEYPNVHDDIIGKDPRKDLRIIETKQVWP